MMDDSALLIWFLIHLKSFWKRNIPKILWRALNYFQDHLLVTNWNEDLLLLILQDLSTIIKNLITVYIQNQSPEHWQRYVNWICFHLCSTVKIAAWCPFTIVSNINNTLKCWLLMIWKDWITYNLIFLSVFWDMEK